MTYALIDFSECETQVNSYDGASAKQKIRYDGNTYMLKISGPLPPDENNPMQASYENASVSEFLSCHIVSSFDIAAQETILGIFNGRQAVACLDFVDNRDDIAELVEFSKLISSSPDIISSGRRTPALSDIETVLSKHPALSDIRKKARQHYWDMFVLDALLGNFDRHAGNWSYLHDRASDKLFSPAPVYDCGACLYPRLNEKSMDECLKNPDLLEKRILTYPKASLVTGADNKKSSYQDFLTSTNAAEVRRSLIRIYPKIDMSAIASIVENAPGITDTHREFYLLNLDMRKNLVLEPAYKLACEERLPSCQREKSMPDIADACSKASQALHQESACPSSSPHGR